MCLSNLYKNEMTENNLLYRNVADIKVIGDKLQITDLMGIRTELEGSIEKIDLMENYIIVKAD